MKIISYLLTYIVLMLTSAIVVAQENDEDKGEQWYQIELLIFSYPLDGDANQEFWFERPRLTYPQRIVELTSAVPTEIILNNPSNSFNEESSFISSEEPRDLELDPKQTNLIDDELEPQSNSTASPLPQITVTLEQQPFSLLDKDQLTFHSFLRRLTRQKDIRLLYHSAWRQPIEKRDQAESILIRGGDKYDDHYELEGSVSFGLERYLHIKTNLWFSTFISNVGQENRWPILPPLPITSSQQAEKKQTDPFLINSKDNQSTTKNHFNQLFFGSTENLYLVDKTVPMQQDRRMRSGELHYIDHPLMGLLVRVTPYEFPIEEVVEEASEEPLPQTEISSEVSEANSGVKTN